MTPVNFFKNLDIHLSEMVISQIRIQKNSSVKETMILSFSQGELNGVEDRVKTYFDLLSKTETNVRIYFRIITLRRFMPATFYSVLVFIYCAFFKVSLLMIDHNSASRIPTIQSLESLSHKLPICFVWFETFEKENVLRRIKPCLFEGCIHIVTDDPLLRLRDIPDLQPYIHLFRFFPAPFFPKRFFKSSDFDSREYEMSFFGAVDDSLGHGGRRFYLDSLSQKWHVHGFFSRMGEKPSRPAYWDMIQDLQSSKIVLNFSNHGGIGALTNRVTEAIACGAVLFSTSEEVLSSFLTPGVHYIRFDNLSHLENLLSELVRNPLKLKSISNAAQEFYVRQYTAEHFLSLLRSEKVIS